MDTKQEVILSVKDLEVKFNLRGKILHAIRGVPWIFIKRKLG